MRRLVRLPNGAWVRPDSVIAVRALPTSTGVGSGNLHRARVTIKTSDGSIDVILANDDEHAQIMADELAGIFNGESNTTTMASEGLPSVDGSASSTGL